MNNFSSKKILGTQTLGDRLRRARKQNGLSYRELGATLRINPEFLKYLEYGQYNQLPGKIYIKNYLKKYCQYLNLNWPNLEKIFEQEIIIYQQKQPKKMQSKFNQHALILPKIAVLAGLIVLLAAISIYIISETINISRPPLLTVYDFPDQQSITTHSVTLKGKTDPEAKVTINWQEITIDAAGNFTELINLQEGINTLRIAAKNKHSKENIIYKQILVKN